MAENHDSGNPSARHTPGPWHWDADPIKDDPLGRVRFRVVTTGRTITLMYYPSGDGQAEADTKLIAAAPDLLEALKEITTLFQTALLCTTPAIAKDGMVYVRKARSALSKATEGR